MSVSVLFTSQRDLNFCKYHRDKKEAPDPLAVEDLISYLMLMRPNKAETAVHGCHCSGDMGVCIRNVLARPWVGVGVCHLLLLFTSYDRPRDKIRHDFVAYKLIVPSSSIICFLLNN